MTEDLSRHYRWLLLASVVLFSVSLVMLKSYGAHNQGIAITPCFAFIGTLALLLLLLTHWLVWRRIISPLAGELRTSKQALQQLHDTHTLHSAVLNCTRDAMIVTDAASRIVEFNPGAEHIFAYQREAVLGCRLSDYIIAPELRETYEKGVQQYLQSRRPGKTGAPIEFETLRADGSVFLAELVFSEISIAGRSLVVICIRDLTRSKRLENEMMRQREALHQSEKMSALGSLLSGVAHELNNPLSIVVGRAIMLEAEAPDPHFAAGIRKIRDAAERCARIVKTFVAIARQRTPEPDWIQLNDVIRSAAEITGQGLQNHAIELELELAPELPKLWADGAQLSQVFMNLIVNAQQALQQAGGVRRLGIRTVFDSIGKNAYIHFIDSGPGIAQALRTRIFEPFFTTRGSSIGLGVGLSVSYGIIQSHRGSITLQDSDGHNGAHFVIRLPIDDSGS
jgi:two-component system NtrC family sensor kinase